MNNILPYPLFEAKQVGVLYHFVAEDENEFDEDGNETFGFLRSILSSNELRTGYHEYISFTRNKNLGFGGSKVRLVINGDKLSNAYKIVPYHDEENGAGDENEERYVPTAKNDTIKNIIQYILRVEIDADYQGSTQKEIDGLSSLYEVPFVYVKNFTRKTTLTNIKPITLPGYYPHMDAPPHPPLPGYYSRVLEGKQVGVLYHFVGEDDNETDDDGNETLGSLEAILSSNKLYNEQYGYISFTRNKNLGFDGRKVRLVIDGNKLSARYKIDPFHDLENWVADEDEERYVQTWRRSSIKPILSFILRIEIDAFYQDRTQHDAKRLAAEYNVPIVYVANYTRTSTLRNIHPKHLPGYGW